MTPGNCWSRRISLSLRFLLKCTATQKYEFATCLLARTASRCWRAYILLHCFFFFLFSFFFCLSMPNRGAQSSLNTYSVITAIWIMWSEFPSYLTPRSGGIKLFFLWLTLNFDQTYICNGTWCQQSERNLSIYSDSHTYLPKFGEHWSRNGWERLASFRPPPKFSHWETLPALPYGRYITDSRQTLARYVFWSQTKWVSRALCGTFLCVFLRYYVENQTHRQWWLKPYPMIAVSMGNET